MIPLMLLLLGSLSACCPPCEKGFIADFALQEATNDWFAFLNQDTRLFEDETGRQMVFTYEPGTRGFEDLEEDCTFDERCGACCYQYRSAFFYTELRSADGAFAINLTLRKNFLTHSVFDEPATVDDYLSMTLNNQLTCELFGIPGQTLTRTLTLNGHLYNQVWYCEANLPPNAPPTTPAGCYFTRADGIVGLTLADGTTWSLIP
ncbi:MAG: hypothetical protein D6722_23405 [Bacteroidetes bacterium]|nr:MAG: hypothetical protein D6722_23405 [Bacteroidota bacterium]